MRTWIGIALIAVAGCISTDAKAGMKCFQDQKVVDVRQGYVDGSLGADGGHAIYFTLGNGRTYPINNGLNLNDHPGKAHLTTLLLAMISGYKITGWDHYGYGGTCDDIDELWTKP